MIYRRPRSIVSRLMVPVCVVLLVVGVFGTVWLRSQITSMEYRIGRLEREKKEALKDEKALMAEMASMLSIQEVQTRGLALTFPDRQRVVYVKREHGEVPFTASLRSE